MNMLQIISRARRLTHTSENNYSDTDAIEDGNLIYQELIDAVATEVDEDYFWDIGTTDTVIGQSEYSIEDILIGSNTVDIKKVNKVYIKYNENVILHSKARFLNPSSLEFVEEFYETNQPQSDPFFYFKDKSVFIYPAPISIITGGLKINIIHVPPNLTISSTEDDIEIPFQFHKIISTGMKQYIYGSQGKINEKNDAIKEFEAEKEKMITFLKDRYNLPGESVEPNLTILE